MTAGRLRQVSGWTTPLLVLFIVVFTLVLSPGEGGSVSRLIPATVPIVGDRTAYDACVGGIPCRDGHAIAFVALGLSLAIQLVAGHRGRRALIGAAIAIGVTIFLATASETLQGVTGRDAEFGDWMADILGGLLGTALGVGIAGLVRRRA